MATPSVNKEQPSDCRGLLPDAVTFTDRRDRRASPREDPEVQTQNELQSEAKDTDLWQRWEYLRTSSQGAVM